jgi:YD repeat-containing protein
MWGGINPYLVDSITERSGQTNSFSYDKLNRVVSITDPFAGVTQFFYGANGKCAQFIDPKGNITKFNRDYAATRATAFQKQVLATSLPGYNPGKLPLFCSQIISWGHDSKDFAERVTYFLKI